MKSYNSKVESLIEKHSNQRKALIPILRDIQEEYNYLPQEALILVSECLHIPLIDIVDVATFYRAFSLEPRGKHTVTVCLGTACHVRGGPKVLEEFERKLNITAGHTTEDKKFTLETVNCFGCCAIGPVVVVDRDYYAQTNIRKVDSILKNYRTERRRRNNEREKNTRQNRFS
jgi:NADH:ubiquinone oxidoreductase subunit E